MLSKSGREKHRLLHMHGDCLLNWKRIEPGERLLTTSCDIDCKILPLPVEVTLNLGIFQGELASCFFLLLIPAYTTVMRAAYIEVAKKYVADIHRLRTSGEVPSMTIYEMLMMIPPGSRGIGLGKYLDRAEVR
eukprot:s1793_g18.t1